MFAPPPNECGWWVLPATMEDGSAVDAHRLRHQQHAPREPLSFARPVTPAYQHNSMLWHRFYETLSDTSREVGGEAEALRYHLAHNYCRRLSLRQLEIRFMVEHYAPGRTWAHRPTVLLTESRHLATVDCADVSGGDGGTGRSTDERQEWREAQPRDRVLSEQSVAQTAGASPRVVLDDTLELFGSKMSTREWCAAVELAHAASVVAMAAPWR